MKKFLIVAHRGVPDQSPENTLASFQRAIDLGADAIELDVRLTADQAPVVYHYYYRELTPFKDHWPSYEITSYEPALLLAMQKLCPGLATNLLFPRSESWMGSDVVQYLAIQRTRLAQASAVHLHPSQLSASIVAALHHHGITVHAWDVNDEQALAKIARLGIPRICTDNFPLALAFREQKINRSIEKGRYHVQSPASSLHGRHTPFRGLHLCPRSHLL